MSWLPSGSFRPTRSAYWKRWESIAAALADAKVNARTRQLLAFRGINEQMQAQEEARMENLEELEATQEEMRRKEKKYLKKIAELEQAVLANR